jgi:hypothetical protein
MPTVVIITMSASFNVHPEYLSAFRTLVPEPTASNLPADIVIFRIHKNKIMVTEFHPDRLYKTLNHS